MPRIDPQQLLVCLTPLLAPNGGIKSPHEVTRLANLMEKYSKKLVSKCIYIQILKCTETDLLGEFMAAGGWNLVHNWLSDGNTSVNWAFVKEILEMLLLCPVDGNRLKSNHTPKIVKSLSMTCHDQTVKLLASKLVEQWLKIAQQEKLQLKATQAQNGIEQNIVVNFVENSSETVNGQVKDSKSEEESKKQSKENVKYKISNKEGSGKLLLSLKRSLSPSTDEQDSKISRSSSVDSKSKSDNDKDKSKHKKSSSSSSRKSSSSSKSSHRDKERSSSVSSSSHHKSSSSSKDKHKDSSKSSSSKHSSSSSSRDKSKDKEREKSKKDTEKSQAEKDKETLDFLTPLSSSKLQRIPKRQHSENSENKSSELNKDSAEPSPNKIAKPTENVERKKPSISIEVRKGEKPKTVKTLNSQFRNHGLAEEPPKPPSRRDLKKPASITTVPTTLPSSSPTMKISTSPPPKKIQLDKPLEMEIPERVGGVKLIKPKPMLFESIGFMDALSASAGAKKDPKKRKRLGSKKDEPESPKIEVKPLKFYKDTFEEEETAGEKSPTKDIDSATEEKDVRAEEADIKTDDVEEVASDKAADVSNDAKSPDSEEPEEKRPPGIGCEPDGPPGVLVHPNMPRRKKRAIKWRADEDLTEIRYFELDETERTNVSKTFTEQKQMEHVEERSAFQLGRKMQNDDTMVEQINWKALVTIDNIPDNIKYGSKSLEAQIQAEREKNVLQELYFRHSINDSPHEPDPESFEHLEPRIVPLEDVTGNPDSVNDFTAIQWPAPKGELPLSMVSNNAFANVFNALNVPPVGLPPNMAINPMANPLASFGIMPNALGREIQNPIMSPWLAPPTATFMAQPPPNVLPGPGFGNRGNNNFRGNPRPHNNGGGPGGNWVRGNARRGICNQFQRTGFCRNKNCPYVHER